MFRWVCLDSPNICGTIDVIQNKLVDKLSKDTVEMLQLQAQTGSLVPSVVLASYLAEVV